MILPLTWANIWQFVINLIIIALNSIGPGVTSSIKLDFIFSSEQQLQI